MSVVYIIRRKEEAHEPDIGGDVSKVYLAWRYDRSFSAVQIFLLIS